MGNEIFEYDGDYTFSYFTIRVKTEIDPDKLFTKEYFHTIIHEYIHFIQDVSTMFCVSTFTNNANELSEFYLYEKPNSIEIPFVEHLSKQSKSNKDFYSAVMNRDAHTSLPFEPDSLEVKNHESINIDNYGDIPLFTLKYKKLNAEMNLNFGAMAILESMAYIVENHFYPKEKRHFIHPYDTAYLVVKAKYPEIAEDPINIFCICEASLTYSNPAESFITILEKMKNEGFIPENYESIYIFFENNIYFHGITTTEYIEESYKKAIWQVKNIINSNIHKDVKNWVVLLLKKFCNIRKRNQHVFLDILKSCKESGLNKLFTLFSKTGTPLIINSRGTAAHVVDEWRSYNKIDNDPFFYWPALKGISEQLFITGEVCCPLIEICSHAHDVCYEEPWNFNKELLCLYNQLYKMLGLSGKELKAR